MSARLCRFCALFLLSLTSAVAQNAPGAAQSIFNRAVADFKNARIMEAASGFDQVAKLVPDQCAATLAAWHRALLRGQISGLPRAVRIASHGKS